MSDGPSGVGSGPGPWRAWHGPPTPSPTGAVSTLGPASVEGTSETTRVHYADRETEAQRVLVLATSPTQSPLAFPREQQFPPTPERSGMFQKSSFNVRIPLQPLNGGVGLEPGPV